MANNKEQKRLPALDFDKIFDEYIAGDQKVWANDRNKTLGASEAFGCMRQAFFKKHGFKEDPGYKNRWGAMRRGDLIENFHVVPAMEAALPKEYELLGGGDDQETLVKGLLSATPDGLIIDLPKHALEVYGIDDIESDCIVMEIKSIDPRVNLREEKAIHRGQVQAQMGLIREMSDFNPMYAVIMYIDASFLDDVEYFIVKFDQKAYNIANKRAAEIFKAKKPMNVKAEGLITGACEYCGYQEQCKKAIIAAIPNSESDVEDKIIKTMNAIIKKRNDLNQKHKDAEAAYKQANEEVKEFLRDNDVKRMVGDNWRVSYSAVKGRTTYDHKAMIKDGMDLSSYEKVGAGYDKLTVTISK